MARGRKPNAMDVVVYYQTTEATTPSTSRVAYTLAASVQTMIDSGRLVVVDGQVIPAPVETTENVPNPPAA